MCEGFLKTHHISISFNVCVRDIYHLFIYMSGIFSLFKTIMKKLYVSHFFL
jgi:hypothetical protein